LSDKKKILIAPLDWGLGHAARCVPIINDLKKNHEIVLAGSGRVKSFLNLAFPNLEFIDFEGYNISYPDKGSMAIKMMLQMPKVLGRIKEEQKELQELIKTHSIDVVISDNRFGLHSDLIPTVYITHQIHIQAPGVLEDRLFKMHKKYIDRFDQCWIPDHAEVPNLSGALSHGIGLDHAKFIGPLSRLKKVETKIIYDYCALISGPEPQRTKFEEHIRSCFIGKKESLLILSGKPEEEAVVTHHNITTISHANDSELARLVSSSAKVIARPGYSTLMDLSALGSKAIFIPTPGQTEQEYLAKFHFEQNQIPIIEQKKLTFERITTCESQNIPAIPSSTDFNSLL